MSNWRDRTKISAYTSPQNNIRQTFLYTDLTQEITKKTTVYEFPDILGTYVQDQGVTSRKCPMVCYFSGPDCDFEADSFMELLSQTGVGLLEHPVYGTINVTPVGTIRREDPRVNGANEVRITVTFVETIGQIYPEAIQGTPDAIIVGTAQWYEGSAEQVNEKADIATVTKHKAWSDYINEALDDINEALKPLYDTFETVQKEYNAISDSITRGLDILVGQPATLAFQTSLLIQAPSRTLTTLRNKLVGYGRVIDTAIKGVPEQESNNDFLINDVIAGSALGGICESAVRGTFDTQEGAIEYAETLANKFEEYQNWRDTQFTDRGIADSADAYRALQEAVALTIGYVIRASFNARRRFEIELDRDRNIIELGAELYGTVDENLDFLIDSNNLVGRELLVVPKGRKIVYYDISN